jgi:hypothetical protein
VSRVTFLRHADVLYRRFSELLFPGDDGDGGDETGDQEPSVPRRPPPPPDTGRQDTQPIPRRPPPGS